MKTQHDMTSRGVVASCLLLGAFAVVALRAFQVQVLEQSYWKGESNYLHKVEISAHRGVITDRNGEPLAISTPVDSVWVNPRSFLQLPQAQRDQLAVALEIKPAELREKLDGKENKRFVFLKRQLEPQIVQAINGLKLQGVRMEREFKRYYPNNEVTSQLLGYTNIDDRGQEGVEVAFDHWLRGTKGVERVIKDAEQHIIQHVEAVSAPQPGHELQLSVDRDIQYITFKALEAAMKKHAAKAASAVVIDVGTGEVLAMANFPGFNPHVREARSWRVKNRVVTDLFEPGSTVKPFIVANALASGAYQAHTLIDTSPGFMQVGNRRIHDIHDYGVIDVATVLQKSSNVGASKIALSMPPKQTWNMFRELGWGKVSRLGFPDETSGVLRHYTQWTEVDQAAIAYGYGVSTTALQLAQAYATLANDGVQLPVSLLRVQNAPAGTRIFPASVTRQVVSMLESVVEEGGTGKHASVKGYRVAGKTGTVRKNFGGRYSQNDYVALFAGFGPVSAPRLAMVVVVDSPARGEYYGGTVAAPVFAQVMTASLRHLSVWPDDIRPDDVQLAKSGL